MCYYSGSSSSPIGYGASHLDHICCAPDKNQTLKMGEEIAHYIVCWYHVSFKREEDQLLLLIGYGWTGVVIMR